MSDNKNKSYSQEPDFEGGTKEIKTHFFYYGRGMQQKCLTSSKKYLNFIGTKFGESVKQSIELDCLIVTEMAAPKVYKDEAEFNRIHVTVPLTGQAFGVFFLWGCISLKNRT
jgi:hypothetical protein